MPTFVELRDHARQRLSAELGRPCTPEEMAGVCDFLGLCALNGGPPTSLPETQYDPMLVSALGEIARRFRPLLEQLQAELARLIAEARQRDLGEEAQKLPKGRLWHEFVMAPNEGANRDLPRMTLRQIRAHVDREVSDTLGLTGEACRTLRHVIYRAATGGPTALAADLGDPATWPEEVEVDWAAELPWRLTEEMAMLRRAVYRLMEEAYARGKRGGAIDREVARRVNREFIGTKGS